ncbi:MAG TPA: hypothetical protein VGQ71_15525, partial [Terriglobales bacterium]|nr:hypothetical protein [Terriglobales bacterium]
IDPNIPQCNHIKLNGVRCGSPALRGKDLFYFHNRVRERHQSYIPFLEDGNSVQFSLVKIMRAIMDDEIDPKKAGLLLYALQIAATNIKQVRTEPYWDKVRPPRPLRARPHAPAQSPAQAPAERNCSPSARPKEETTA